jgi:hypothetical protein
MPCSHSHCKKRKCQPIGVQVVTQPHLHASCPPLESITEYPIDIDLDVKKYYKIKKVNCHGKCQYKLVCKTKVIPKVHANCHPQVSQGHINLSASVQAHAYCT